MDIQDLVSALQDGPYPEIDIVNLSPNLDNNEDSNESIIDCCYTNCNVNESPEDDHSYQE